MVLFETFECRSPIHFAAISGNVMIFSAFLMLKVPLEICDIFFGIDL